ncbi:thioesterase family protein [bacterium]|nr:thioesterase family protein [bacterium]
MVIGPAPSNFTPHRLPPTTDCLPVPCGQRQPLRYRTIRTVASRFGSWGPGGASASLDHAMWFHHAPKFDGWLLFNSESPTAHNARAVIFGGIWSQAGVRVASVAQEGLVRTPKQE